MPYARKTPEQRQAANRISTRNAVRRNRALVAAARSGACVDCGRDDLPPECMDLDHVRGVKSFNVVQSISKPYTRKQVEAEIAKCDLRCPTCHRLRHYREKQALEAVA